TDGSDSDDSDDDLALRELGREAGGRGDADDFVGDVDSDGDVEGDDVEGDSAGDDDGNDGNNFDHDGDGNGFDDDDDDDASIDSHSPLEPFDDADGDGGRDGDDEGDVGDWAWGDLPAFVRDLIVAIEDERIKRVNNELEGLKARLKPIVMGRTSDGGASGTVSGTGEELARLGKESAELNNYIIQELHRRGYDQCSNAMRRLLSKKERRENAGKLSEAQEKMCRRSAIYLLDLDVAELLEKVKGVDASVTAFQKEVSAAVKNWQAGHEGQGDDSSSVGRELGNAPQANSRTRKKRKTRRAASSNKDDRHRHASRKRKVRKSRPEAGRKKRHRDPNVEDVSVLDARSEATAGGQVATPSPSEDNRDEENGARDPMEADIEFIGETDEFDDCPSGSVLPNIGGAARRRQHTNGAETSRPSSQRSGSQRQQRPISESMEVWYQRQSADDAGVLQSMNNGQSSTRRGNNASIATRNGSSTSRNRGSSGANPMQGPRARTGHNAHSNNGRMAQTVNARSRSDRQSVAAQGVHGNARPNSTSYGRSGSSSVVKNTIHASRVGREASYLSSRPPIPDSLSAEALFSFLSRRRVDAITEAGEETGAQPVGSRSLSELCQVLKDSYPSRLESSQETLTALKALVTSRSETLETDDIVLLFGALYNSAFKTRCTTLLDVVQAEPEAAVIQVECWCLAFRMIAGKMNSKLREGDGILYKTFGRGAVTKLADLVVLQVIDVLYSQLLWEEYGKTPTFDDRVFGSLRTLCGQIGEISPLLPRACGLLMNRFGNLAWHQSLANQQKENELDKVFFVSAIDPKSHQDFVLTGDTSGFESGSGARIRKFGRKIPRIEIEAIWSIMAFFSCSAITKTSTPDFPQPQKLLNFITKSECGTLAKTGGCPLPPSKLQVDTASREVRWICTLLSSKMLGNLPAVDDLVDQAVRRAVMLEAFDQILDPLLAPPTARISKVVKQLWRYSSNTGSSTKLQSNLQTSIVDVDSIFANAGPITDVCSLMPSSDLLQRCMSLVATYAEMAMTKKPKWRNFRGKLSSLLSNFEERATDQEKSANARADQRMDDFAAMFQSIEMATEVQLVNLRSNSHLREAACFLMLATVVARSQYDVPGDGDISHLNRAFREKIWKYASDEKMRLHQKHFLHKVPGDAPPSSRNICLLFASAKIMAFATLLHLHVVDFKSDPHQIAERLRSHLIAVKVDDDENMMEFLLSSIISSLLASCDLLTDLNHHGHVSEQEDTCKAHLDSSKSCVKVIRSIATWLILIFGRAKFFLDLMAEVTPPGNELSKMADAIKRLGSSSFFFFVMRSLTRALSVMIESAARNAFAEVLCRDGLLEKALRCCLGAIRTYASLVNSNSTSETISAESKDEYGAAVELYLSLVRNTVIPSLLDKGSNSEHGKLCHSQSGGVLSVLASLCSVRQAQRVLSGVYDLFKFKPRPEQSKTNANHLQQLGICFSAELACLARHSGSCRAIAAKHVKELLNYLLASLLDADTLAMFPTSNLSLLTEYGGHDSRSRGNDLLSKAQIHSPMNHQDPDQEARKITRLSGDYFDTAGPTYTSKNLWSFCENVGNVLLLYDDATHSQQTQAVIQSMGTDMISACTSLCSDKGLLELLPQVSTERECLKRLHVIRAILMATKRDEEQNLDTVQGTEGGLPLAISKSILENLHYLSGIEMEVEEQRKMGCVDAASRHQRAKALTFQRAYTEFCGTLTTMMLRDKAIQRNANAHDILWNSIIMPTFKGKDDVRRAIERAATEFNLCLRKTSCTGHLKFMSLDLRLSLWRHSGDLLVYGASCTNSNFGRVLLNTMLEYSSTWPQSSHISKEDLLEVISRRLVLMPETTSFCTISHGLQRSADSIVSKDSPGSDELHQLKQLTVSLREWAMGDRFVYLLEHWRTPPPLRANTLKLLTNMIEKFSSGGIVPPKTIQDPSGNLASIATYTKLLYALKECLSSNIRSNSLDAALIADLFSCTRHFFALPVFNYTPNDSAKRLSLLSWATYSSRNKTCNGLHSASSAYISEISTWLCACGKLLKSQAFISPLRSFVAALNRKDFLGKHPLEDESNLDEMREFCSSTNSLITIEKDLSLGEVRAAQSSDRYKGMTSNISYSGDESNISHESLAAIDEFTAYCQAVKSANI
ncbi:hypothetical protein ACHAWF_014162, partial [Thalassiosira exigua]